MAPSDDRPCGLYRTTAPLPGREDKLGAGQLVFYHNHSEQGSPLVLTPHASTDNRWEFHTKGWLVDDPGWPATLEPLQPEGYYVLTQHVHLARHEEVLPERTLVQLSYDRGGRVILFPARLEGRTIRFPERGFGFGDDVFERLEPAGFLVATAKVGPTLH